MVSSLSLIFSTKDEPVFKYEVEKGIECITDKVSVYGDYVVMVPSWPLEAQAIVMTLDINNKMAEAGKYLLADPVSQSSLDENWEHTQLRVVRCQAVVVYKAPKWLVLITSLPDCTPLQHLTLTGVGHLYECQQIRSYKSTTVILFTEKKLEQVRSRVSSLLTWEEYYWQGHL